MQLSPDVRYVQDGPHMLAVVFDGCYFTTYHVGREHAGVNVTATVIADVYPEVNQDALLHVGHYGSSVPNRGVWALETVAAEDGLPPLPKRVTSAIRERPTGSLDYLQCRLAELSTTNVDLIKTLDRTIDSLDEVVAAPTRLSAWAGALLPIVEASVHSGVSIDDILKEAHKQVDRLERKLTYTE